MVQRIDITGQKFNFLTAIERIKGGYWLFRCDCGVEKILDSYDVKRNKTKSCGCQQYIYNKETKSKMSNVKCSNCGKEFYKRKKNEQENHYCSKKCYQATLNKSQYITEGGITKIIIPNKTKGEVIAIIDTKNLEKVRHFSWALERNNYVSHRGRRVYVKLHRLITNCPDDMQVDHIDRNPLNNLENNLRICTEFENKQNKPMLNKINKSSGIKNITWDKTKNRWQVGITKNKKFIFIGYYKDLEDAKIAAQEAREKYHPFFVDK